MKRAKTTATGRDVHVKQQQQQQKKNSLNVSINHEQAGKHLHRDSQRIKTNRSRVELNEERLVN